MMKVIIFLIIGILLLALCSKHYLHHEKIKPIPVRIPDYTENTIETNEEKIMITIQEGDCLSRIVEKCINEYLETNGHQGMFKFKGTLYDIVNSIKTRSGNPDLTYPGDIISFKLPETLKVYKFDYYHKEEQIYGLDSLMKLLDFHWLIEYDKGMFNCSERASFVEYYLENEGFNVLIVGNKNHAWVIVEVEPDEWVNVECVCSPPAVGKAPDSYKVRYENIYEAIKTEPNEYDWWNRVSDGMVIGKQLKHRKQ
ncbi:MAG: hypothetical protein WBB67_12170 [bacterium]